MAQQCHALLLTTPHEGGFGLGFLGPAWRQIASWSSWQTACWWRQLPWAIPAAAGCSPNPSDANCSRPCPQRTWLKLKLHQAGCLRWLHELPNAMLKLQGQQVPSGRQALSQITSTPRRLVQSKPSPNSDERNTNHRCNTVNTLVLVQCVTPHI